MKIPYIFDAGKGVVRICGWHPNKQELEARAAREHPGAPVSHGICDACRVQLRYEIADPKAGWLPPNEDLQGVLVQLKQQHQQPT